MKVEQIKVTVSNDELRQAYIENFRKLWAGTGDVEIVVNVADTPAPPPPKAVTNHAPTQGKKTADLAKAYGVHPMTIRRWVREGVLKEKLDTLSQGKLTSPLVGRKRSATQTTRQIKFNIKAAQERSGLSVADFCSKAGFHYSVFNRACASGTVTKKTLGQINTLMEKIKAEATSSAAGSHLALGTTLKCTSGMSHQIVSVAIRSDGTNTYRLRNARGFTTAMTESEVERFLATN